MLSNLTSVEYAFWMCALAGTLFFVLRVMLIVVGGFGGDDLSGGHDMGHVDTSGMDAHDMTDSSSVHDSDVAFKLLSLNSISAFIMMFGWAGLAAAKQHQLGAALSTLVAFTAGFVMMVLTSYLFVLARKFTTEGADFRIEKVIGKTAKVYMRIPENGRGKVHITVDNLLRELDAETEDGKAVDSFASVTITEAVGPSLVKVRPLSNA